MALGRVILVGAGPGAPDLLTIRGLRALRKADVILQDRLLPRDFLDRAGVATERKHLVHLGDEKGGMRQRDINDALLALAREGKTVIRLKTGDPYIFGRGAEEVEFLAENGVPVEVIPGISSATGGPALGRFPLTRRGASRSFAVVSAREAGGTVTGTWPRADNLVILMGVGRLGEVRDNLLQAGWPGDTPVAAIERASMEWERRLWSNLQEIPAAAASAGLAPPALLLVGPAARRSGGSPLILYTGLDPSNFRHLGDILHWPAVSLKKKLSYVTRTSEALAAIGQGEFDCVTFTSRSGVDAFFEAAARLRADARALAGTRVIPAGAGTAERLSEYGVEPDAIPEEAGADGILQACRGTRSALVIQGSHAPGHLLEALSAAGTKVRRISLHEVLPNPDLGRPLPDFDVAYFASPSGVRSFIAAYGTAPLQHRETWCIGSVTREALKEAGVNAEVVYPHAYKNETIPAY